MSEQEFIKRWTEIDATDSPKYQSYLSQVSSLESVQQYKDLSFSMLRVAVGNHVLDVGCGNGDDVRTLARSVGDGGLVVGVDLSAALIAGADAHPDNASLPVKFVIDDAHNLMFEDATFDRCRADRVFQHVPQRERALSEMIRVTKPRGWITVADPDWGTLVVDAPTNRGTTRKVIEYIADNAATDGWAARESYRLCKQAGLMDVSVMPVSVILTELSVAGPLYHLETSLAEMVRQGALDEEEANHWIGALRETDAKGHFLSALSGFVVAAQKQ